MAAINQYFSHTFLEFALKTSLEKVEFASKNAKALDEKLASLLAG